MADGWLNRMFGPQEDPYTHQMSPNPLGMGLLNFGGSLMANSGPSLQPMSFLGNVGKALPSFSEGYYGAQQMGDDQLDRQMKMQDLQDRMGQRKQAMDWLRPVGGTPLSQGGGQPQGAAIPQPGDGTQPPMGGQGMPSQGGGGRQTFRDVIQALPDEDKAYFATNQKALMAFHDDWMKNQLMPDHSGIYKEWQDYKGTGGNLGFNDYSNMDANRHATRINVSTNMPPMPKAFDETVGKGLGETYLEVNKNAQTSQGKLAKYNQLRNLLGQPNVVQGFAGSEIGQAKNLALSLGLLDEEQAKSLGPTQAAEAISNGLALQLRNPAGGEGMPGSLSNTDRDYLNRMVPNLSKVPEGNRILIDYAVKMENRNIDIAKFANNYVKQNGRLDAGFYSALSDWSEKNPLFADQPEYSGPANHGSRTTKTGVQWSQPQ